MKFVHSFFAFMFIGFAALQVNDPDPVLWILIYGSVAVVCVLAVFEKYDKRVLVVLSVAFVVYCVMLWPGVSEWLQQEDKGVLFDDVMKMEYPYIEESREFLGLLICLLVLAFYLIRALRKKPV